MLETLAGKACAVAWWHKTIQMYSRWMWASTWFASRYFFVLLILFLFNENPFSLFSFRSCVYSPWKLALQKHVNGHFNATENKDNPSKRASDPPVPKQLRKNGKKLRYRRQPFSGKSNNY